MTMRLYDEMKPRTTTEGIVAFVLIFGMNVARMFLLRAVLRSLRARA